MNMLFVIYLCALLSIGTSVNMAKRKVQLIPEHAAFIRAAYLKCGDEYGISPNTIDLIKGGYYSEDDTFKKYMFCIYQETGYGKSDGHINIAKAVPLYPKDLNMMAIFENCDALQGADPIETAFLNFKCYQETSPAWLEF